MIGDGIDRVNSTEYLYPKHTNYQFILSNMNLLPSFKLIYAFSSFPCPQQASLMKSQVVKPCKQKSQSITPLMSNHGLLHRVQTFLCLYPKFPSLSCHSFVSSLKINSPF